MTQVHIYKNQQVNVVRRFSDCWMVQAADNPKAELVPLAIGEGKEMPDGLVLAHPGMISTSAKVTSLNQRVVNFAPDPLPPDRSKMTDTILTNPANERNPVLNELPGYDNRPESENIIIDSTPDVVSTNIEPESSLPPFDINTATPESILATFKGISRVSCNKVIDRRPVQGYGNVQELIALNKDVRVDWKAIEDQLAFSQSEVS